MARLFSGLVVVTLWQLVAPFHLRLVQGIPSSSGTVVTITAPTSSATYDAGTASTLTTLAGTAKANQTISTCTWTNSLGGSGSATGTATWSIASISLTVGTNVITVTCPNAIGTGTDVISVTRSSGLTCTTTTADTSYTLVNAAVSGASAGDVVCLPAGSSTWGSTLTLTKAITLSGVACSLDGNGRPSSCTTVITAGANPLISVNPSTPADDPVIRVTGLSLDGNASNDAIRLSNSSTSVALSKIRVDHNIIKNASNSSTNGVYVTDDVWALVDHNLFQNNQIHIRALGNSGTSWSNFPAAAGTATKPYIEDNTFSQTTTDSSFLVEGGQGGRYVFRYNIVTFTPGTGFWEMFDMHGNNGPVLGDNRGTVETEVYGNTFTVETTVDRFAFVRGGDAKIFNNTITQGGGSLTFHLTEYDGWSYCETAAGAPPPSYPGDDAVREAFFFNNLRDGATFTPALYDTAPCGCTFSGSDRCDDFFLQLNRDYFLPSSGLASARPGSCTDNTYYGATDTGVISKCHPANTWTTYYTPYTYPHPRGGS